MNTDQRLGKFGGWALDVLRLLVGKPHARVATGLVVLAIVLVNNVWLPLLAAAVGQMTWPEAIKNSDASPASIGAALGCAALAAIVVLIGMRMDKKAVKTGTIIAVRHRSFDGAPPGVQPDDLPRAHREAAIIHEEIDQTSFFGGGILTDPGAALRVQASLATRLRTQLQAHPDAVVAYYGKAHIPLAFAAGYAAQVDPRVLHFELARSGAVKWIAIAPDDGPDLGITVEEDTPGGGADAVIRISVSYLVGMPDILARLPSIGRNIHIRLADLKPDAVMHQGQIDKLARQFRAALDNLQKDLPQPSCIHVFCAAPVSVVFALGRQLSPTIHPPVVVHNYSQASRPHYAWGVQVNGAPEPFLVLPPSSPEILRVQPAR